MVVKLLSPLPGALTLGEWGGGCRETVDGEDLELDASVDWLEAGGEMQLRVTNLKDNKKLYVVFIAFILDSGYKGKRPV